MSTLSATRKRTGEFWMERFLQMEYAEVDFCHEFALGN
jgi:hypothetical protein